MKKLYTLIVLVFLSATTFGQLIINEVLYDPSNTDLEGDANGDGVYDQEFDSFIEFVNTGSTNLDISGYEIWDDLSSDEAVFIFPAETWVPPNGAVVVFGGPTLTGDFGGAIVLATENANGMNLNNSGEIIVIKDGDGNEILSFDSDALSNNPNESYTRNPDITGDFEQHSDNTELLFSPGTMIDGTPFSTAFIVENITVQGEGGVNTIDMPAETLQMEAMIMPAFATDQTVTWSLADGTTAASISDMGLLTAIEDGVVTVIATANDGSGVFGSTDITISNQSNGVEDKSFETASVYPNPANNQITILSEANINNIQVIDLTGKSVMNVPMNKNGIDISALNRGIYIVKAYAETGIITTRFVKL